MDALLELNRVIGRYQETPMDELHRIAREAAESVRQSRVDKEESDLVNTTCDRRV